mgnify:CR=1 FL=1
MSGTEDCGNCGECALAGRWRRHARGQERPSLANSLEVFKSTVENEDYVMGEMQQKAAESGLLKEIIFGRNEPALHHFHNNYRAALGQPLLERL